MPPFGFTSSSKQCETRKETRCATAILLVSFAEYASSSSSASSPSSSSMVAHRRSSDKLSATASRAVREDGKMQSGQRGSCWLYRCRGLLRRKTGSGKKLQGTLGKSRSSSRRRKYPITWSMQKSSCRTIRSVRRIAPSRGKISIIYQIWASPCLKWALQTIPG